MNALFSPFLFEKAKCFLNNSNNILLLSHLDADGLTSASIIALFLKKMDKTFTVRIIKQLENINEIKETKSDLVIITDMGSGQFGLLKEVINERKIIIIDHHQVQDQFEHENLVHFNPALYDDTISASGVSYIVIKGLNPGFEDKSYLSLIGAIGDNQFEEGFKGLNLELLNDFVEKGIIKKIKGLNVFGRVSKPVHEALSNNFDLIIPGVNGNESAAIQLLSDINIDLKNSDGSWKTLANMSEQEMKKLVTNIIMRRISHNLDPNIISDVLEISNESGLTSDLKEWSVLLNSSGRQGFQSLGVLLNMGYKSYALPKIDDLLKEYRKTLTKSLEYVKMNSLLLNDLLVIDGKSEIPDTMIGTVIGMALNSMEYDTINTIIGFADRENETKVSCRTKTSINIGEVLAKVCKKLNFKGGGHKKAGGAVISKESKELFLNSFSEETRGEMLIKDGFV
ncbi:DHHA1 domain protein [Candidatus Tiddalikarchaeum anstoanum]|nr:DHHA1 domain protein [Candidatus Tiddalikarchaeum anstoanum]